MAFNHILIGLDLDFLGLVLAINLKTDVSCFGSPTGITLFLLFVPHVFTPEFKNYFLCGKG